MTASPTFYHSLETQNIVAQIERSWQRSKTAGLERRRNPGIYKVTGRELKSRRHRLASLLQLIETDFLPKYRQAILASSSRVMLTDREGTILEAWGSENFLATAQQVALEPGCRWSEELRGTNAIGTAIAEKAPSLVLAGNHFLNDLGHVSCAASPITDGRGQVTAVLDISGHHADFGGEKIHLVQMMSLDLENQLLREVYAEYDQIRFTNYFDSPVGGLLVFDQGRLIAANRVAILTFQLRPELETYRPEDFIFQGLSELGKQPVSLIQTSAGYLFTRFVPGKTRVHPIRVTPSEDARVKEARKLGKIAVSEGIPLLIQGETGVGKEYLVKQIHRESSRAQAPLVALNCAALPDQLAESELFGHLPGAFTGAHPQGAKGKIREAHRGILFLDEIAELPLSVQAKLLRVLQEKQVMPLGGGQLFEVDFALIAASHKNLEAEVANGRFREDLFFRLCGVEVELPALRERSDFEEIAHAMVERIDPRKKISAGLMTQLRSYSWPGNLRQLDQSLKIACAFSGPATDLEIHHLPKRLNQRAQTSFTTTAGGSQLTARTDQILLQTAQKHHGNITRAAKELGISRNTFYRRLHKAGIAPASLKQK